MKPFFMAFLIFGCNFCIAQKTEVNMEQRCLLLHTLLNESINNRRIFYNDDSIKIKPANIYIKDKQYYFKLCKNSDTKKYKINIIDSTELEMNSISKNQLIINIKELKTLSKYRYEIYFVCLPSNFMGIFYYRYKEGYFKLYKYKSGYY